MRSERLIASAVLLLIAGCADDSPQAEVDCQERLVQTSGDMRAAHGSKESGLGPAFARLSKNLHEMELSGCTKAQVHSSEALAKLARELAGAAHAAESGRKASPSVKGNQALMTFMVQLERFEGIRQRVREELDEMKKGEP